MANTTGDGGGGGSSSSVDISASEFISGTRIRYGLLFSSIFGGTLLAVWEGLIGIVLSFGFGFRIVVDAATRFYVDLVRLLVAVPAAIAVQSFAPLEAAVANSGALGLVGGLVIVLGLIYAVRWGVRQLG